MRWKISYLEAAEKWLNKLSKLELKSRAKELRMIEICGNELKLPHTKSLGSGLFELRERRYGLRLYYCYEKKEAIVMLCGGDKKSQKEDIKKASRLLKQYRGKKNES